MNDLEWLRQEIDRHSEVTEGNEIDNHGLQRWVNADFVDELIDQVEQPTPSNSTGLELPVIPEFLADYIEECKSKKTPLFTAMEYSYEYSDKTARYLFNDTKENNAAKQSVFATAYLFGYTVRTKKYCVTVGGFLMLAKSDEGGEVIACDDTIKRDDSYIKELTEEEIKDYDERFWPFAKEVKE